MESKIFKARDSATAYLRKHKIPKAEYSRYLLAQSDGFHVIPLKPMSPAEEAKLDKATPPPKSKKTRENPGFSCASMARKLVADGLTNEEIWPILRDTFKLDDTKKSYPAWYRAQMRRAALKAKE